MSNYNWRFALCARGGKQDVHLSVKPLPKHMRLLPIIEEAVSKVMIMKARSCSFRVLPRGRVRVTVDAGPSGHLRQLQGFC